MRESKDGGDLWDGESEVGTEKEVYVTARCDRLMPGWTGLDMVNKEHRRVRWLLPFLA